MGIKTNGKTGKTLPNDCDKGTDDLIDKSGLIKGTEDLIEKGGWIDGITKMIDSTQTI